MVTNDFLPFATGVSANIETQVDYAADSKRTNGNQPGVAVSAFNNKALRQACWIASVLAQFIVNTSGSDVLDDANQSNLLAAMALTWPAATAPTQTLLTATGTTAGYVFTCSTANATAGAVYANNGHNYTVLTTLASGTLLFCSGALAPLSSGTLTKQSGTGDATITFSRADALATYTTPASTKYIEVEVVAAGGGGGGGGSGATAGTIGTLSVFGANQFVCLPGGGGGASGGSAGAGGAATAPSNCKANAGSYGGYGQNTNTSNVAGGHGGNSILSGAGAAGAGNVSGVAAATNSGSGGGGGGLASGNFWTGGGGGAGGSAEGIIACSGGTIFYYCVGTGGAAGSGGPTNGGAGADGQIYIKIHYAA